MEALLRWRKSDTQIVPAGEFISIAEQSGLMLDLHEWVIEEAAKAVAEWRRNGWADARVAVNVSAQQFISGDFLGEFQRLLERHKLTPDAIEIELTENVLQTGVMTVETLRGLRQLGVAIALDDFGTGFSSLTSLERLPLTRVKIDRSVVADLDRNPRAAAIARSIIGLCRSLGLQVTVEGVERPSQLDVLATFGEVSVQGYLVASPASEDQVLQFVNRCEALLADALLQAARQDSAPPPDDGETSAIRYLRRKRP
jgi:EAL domain-containing protein (putative c-di-GMP-specific phosphodiesterase class I)